jgi:protease-4
MAIDHGYEDFLSRVAEARGKTRDEVDAIARGRVWSGEDAKELGLVDELGGLEEAIASAAKRAGLEESHRLYYVEEETDLQERLLQRLLLVARGAGWVGEGRPTTPPPLTRALGSIRREVERLARWNDPNGLYSHCLCGEEWP